MRLQLLDFGSGDVVRLFLRVQPMPERGDAAGRDRGEGKQRDPGDEQRDEHQRMPGQSDAERPRHGLSSAERDQKPNRPYGGLVFLAIR